MFFIAAVHQGSFGNFWVLRVVNEGENGQRLRKELLGSYGHACFVCWDEACEVGPQEREHGAAYLVAQYTLLKDGACGNGQSTIMRVKKEGTGDLTRHPSTVIDELSRNRTIF
jgi:hypothetical protein